MTSYLRSLDPRLPRSVQMLQLGGLLNAFGNGLVLPFTFIYLHNVRGMGLGTVGLIVATNGVVSLIAGPIAGSLVDRVGGRRTLGVALVFLAAGFGSFPFVTEPWHGFAAMTLAGIGNGAFWPAQSTLIAGLTPSDRRPAAYAMQRVVMNLGIGIGALVGGGIATTDSPGTFTVLFVLDALTFLGYLTILTTFVPQPPLARHEDGGRPGRYADVVRDRPFLGVIGLNTLFVFAGMSGFELLPVWAKNEAGVTETAIGVVFFVNTVVIVLTQLPIAKLSEGRRRMRLFAALGLLWAACWVLVPLTGAWANGVAAAALLALLMAVFAIGECLHGAVQAPLVVDLAKPQLLGRYMALSALSWQVGFALGPAAGGFLLAVEPSSLWLAAAGVLAVGAVAAVLLERTIPEGARRNPVAGAPVATEDGQETGARIPNAVPVTVDDPLSPHAEPASHPADGAAQRGGRRTPAA